MSDEKHVYCYYCNKEIKKEIANIGVYTGEKKYICHSCFYRKYINFYVDYDLKRLLY
jgi:hypothetical protein